MIGLGYAPSLILFSTMNKKVYLVPQTEVILTEANAILAGSTGATGEDVPWAAKERNIFIDDEFDNDED